MGKSNPTIGYWYLVAYHMGLGLGPIDALLEVRAANKTAWSGNLTASGTITIAKPNLFGGETDQGGIVGDMDVMLGDANATPNPYLVATFGDRTATWRGIASVVFKGGKYGALNPYPQKPAYLLKRIKSGWDSGCWYPEKAEIDASNASLPPTASGWEYQSIPLEADPGHTNLTPPTDGWIQGGSMPFENDTGWDSRTEFWCRRTITVNGTGQKLHVRADNGCVVFLNGVQVGGTNLDNAPISNNPAVFDYVFEGGQSYAIVVKAFCETNPADDGGNFLSLWVESDPVAAMNPAHILYYARTQQCAGRAATTEMNDASFRAAADWYYGQAFGLCTTRNPDKESNEDFIQRICDVAGCAMTRSPVNGQWYLDIANGVYTLGALPILTDDDILSLDYQPTLPNQAINSLSVQYFDTVQKASATTPPIEALGVIAAFGTIHQDQSYPEIPTWNEAAWAAARDLRQIVALTRGLHLVTTRVPYSWRRNTYFRLQSPRNGIADMVCLVGQIDDGTLKSGAMTIDAVQDVYSLPDALYLQREGNVDTLAPQVPIGAAAELVLELPYTTVARNAPTNTLDSLPADAAFIGGIAANPGGFRDFGMDVSSDGGTTYAQTARGRFAPTATVNEADDLTGAAPITAVTFADAIALANVALGEAGLWGDEIVRVDALSASATPPTATLARGCADTIPRVHAAAERIWFFENDIALDKTQYAAGENLDVKLLPASGSAELALADATALPLALVGRPGLPYPPAHVRINGAFNTTSVTGTLTVTWATRNRATQADQLVDTTAASIAPPPDTRYALEIRDAADAILMQKFDIAGATASAESNYTGTITVRLYAINANGVSLQTFARALSYTPPGSPSNVITADTWTAGGGATTIIDGGSP